jgi:hypothetical protein
MSRPASPIVESNRDPSTMMVNVKITTVTTRRESKNLRIIQLGREEE